MLLAELEIWHSRPIAPTRRVALGHCFLPVDPAPGVGSLLLGAVFASHIPDLDPEMMIELVQLLDEVERGKRIPQPRLRHRFQVDRVGLARSRHRLYERDGNFEANFDDHAGASSQVLGAVYATAQMPTETRRVVVSVLRRSMSWKGSIDASLFAYLSDTATSRSQLSLALSDPRAWALTMLNFGEEAGLKDWDTQSPSRKDIQRRFRKLLREAHPDHGGVVEDASQRIIDLSDARSILLDETT